VTSDKLSDKYSDKLSDKLRKASFPEMPCTSAFQKIWDCQSDKWDKKSCSSSKYIQNWGRTIQTKSLKPPNYRFEASKPWVWSLQTSYLLQANSILTLSK